ARSRAARAGGGTLPAHVPGPGRFQVSSTSCSTDQSRKRRNSATEAAHTTAAFKLARSTPSEKRRARAAMRAHPDSVAVRRVIRIRIRLLRRRRRVGRRARAGGREWMLDAVRKLGAAGKNGKSCCEGDLLHADVPLCDG